MPFDQIQVVGNDDQIKKFGPLVERNESQFSENTNQTGVVMRSLTIDEHSVFIGKTLRESNFQAVNCLIISIEKKDRSFVTPNADTVLSAGDLLTIVGQKDRLESIIQGFCSI